MMLVDLEQEHLRTQATRKAKRLGSLFALLALGMMAGSVASLVEFSRERRFARERVIAQATIVRHYMTRGTLYLEAEFIDPAGHNQHRSIMMQKRAWEALEQAKTVPIEYVRSDPSLFRLLRGEHRVGFSKFWIIGLIATLILAAGSVFTFLGYELKPRSGVIQVTRWGATAEASVVHWVSRIGKFLRWGAYLFFGVILLIDAPVCLYRALVHFPIPENVPEMTYQLSPRAFWHCAALGCTIIGTIGLIKTRISRWGRHSDD